MSKIARARRIATAAAYGGGGIGVVGALIAGVVVGQARLTRRSIPRWERPPPPCDGHYGTEHSGDPLSFAVLGDSTGAGLGAELPRETPGALLASGLAEVLSRPVRLICPAVPGARSAQLGPQVEAALATQPELALIFIGANDVTGRQRPADAVAHLGRAVEQLRAAGTEVVVATCPDLGGIPPMRPPLSWLATRWSRQLAAAQTIVVVRAGGRTVSMGDLVAPAARQEPDRFFSSDRYHPSALGYATAAAAILPTLLSALEINQPEGTPLGRDAITSLPAAAVAAAARPGTEVSPASRNTGTTAGGGRWAELRWAALRRRVRLRVATPTGPDNDNLDIPRDTSLATATTSEGQ